MILLALVGLALVGSLLSGGDAALLGKVRFRYAWLIIAGLAIQVLIFSRWWRGLALPAYIGPALYILSNLLLLAAVWLNRRLPGLPLLGAGLLLNAAAIAANGGYMPASLQALRLAGILGPQETFVAGQGTNSSPIVPGTPLWFLGDVFAVPRGWPLANVFSPGDVLIALGAAWLVWRSTRRPAGGDAPAAAA